MAGRKRSNVILGVLGGVLLVGGGSLLVATWLAPQAVEKVYGQAKTGVMGAVEKTKEDVFDDLPTVKISGSVDVPELTLACPDDSSFTIMSSYEREGVPEGLGRLVVVAEHGEAVGEQAVQTGLVAGGRALRGGTRPLPPRPGAVRPVCAGGLCGSFRPAAHHRATVGSPRGGFLPLEHI